MVGLQWETIQRVFRRLLRWALDFPILYKILVANSTLVAVAVTVGTWLGTKHASTPSTHAIHWDFVIPLGASVLSALVLVNYALLKAALQPLSKLTPLITALRRGEVRARLERPLFGDPETNLLIETANNLLEELGAYQRRVQDLSERVTMQLENERRSIARELHDETAQNLVTLLVLEQMISQAGDDDSRLRALEEARRLTRLTLEGVRRMLVGLRPAILDEIGVQGAIAWYAEEVLGNILPEVKLDLDHSLDGLPQVPELALYRIVQEALSNVARHSQAGKVSISLRQEDNQVVLCITDDGVGFDPEAPSLSRRERLGLFIIKERARLAGGEAEVTSQPGQGTTILVRLPLKDYPPRLEEGS